MDVSMNTTSYCGYLIIPLQYMVCEEKKVYFKQNAYYYLSLYNQICPNAEHMFAK